LFSSAFAQRTFGEKRWRLSVRSSTPRASSSRTRLIRLRELEVLEKVTEKAMLSVVLGGGGLAEKAVKLL
jgi:hypothetical protein